MGKGYVDGAGDDNRIAARQSPAASATGLFIFSESPKSASRKMLHARRHSLKGGDPAAGSPTATLLRLHPSL